MWRRKVVPFISAMPWGMGYGNDEGSCSELGLGMCVAVGLDAMIG